MVEKLKKKVDVYWKGSAGSYSTADHKFTPQKPKITILDELAGYYKQDTANFIVCDAGTVLVSEKEKQAAAELKIVESGNLTVINVPGDDGEEDNDSEESTVSADDHPEDESSDESKEDDKDANEVVEETDNEVEENVKVLGKKKKKNK